LSFQLRVHLVDDQSVALGASVKDKFRHIF